MAGGTDARRDFVRRLCAGERGGNVIGQFHPGMSGVKDFRTGAQAMQNLRKKPFTGIRAAAFG
ncbi:hypothetical protein SDC9_193771 [bioreactor metagenome]|uniref:Uncharacterized protein n=1 Tax=bioreactor metagenome TaxID=1076179 RepID=A0A645I4K3_9ZZZZ